MYYVRCEQAGCTFEALDKEFDAVADAFSDHHFEEHGLHEAETHGTWEIREQEPAGQAA